MKPPSEIPPGPGWTRERIEFLHKHWRAYPASMIGMWLNVSRSAVLGAVDRYGCEPKKASTKARRLTDRGQRGGEVRAAQARHANAESRPWKPGDPKPPLLG